MRTRWKHMVTDHLSYKVVSLFIALILWVTILGRRDFSLARSFEVEFLTSPHQTLVFQSVEEVKVKVSGPRTALKRFMETGISPMISLDISKKPDGEHEIKIPIERIDVPFGVKVTSVRPATIKVKLIRR
jgi:YbbR domain-containing protein